MSQNCQLCPLTFFLNPNSFNICFINFKVIIRCYNGTSCVHIWLLHKCLESGTKCPEFSFFFFAVVTTQICDMLTILIWETRKTFCYFSNKQTNGENIASFLEVTKATAKALVFLNGRIYPPLWSRQIQYMKYATIGGLPWYCNYKLD